MVDYVNDRMYSIVLFTRSSTRLCWIINLKVARTSILQTAIPYDIHMQTTETSLFDKHFRFMFVRNPWDRLVSLYNQLIHTPKTYLDIFVEYFNEPTIQQLSFDSYIRQINNINDRDANPHFRSQHLLIPPLNPGVHFLGRFERLSADWQILQDRFDLADLPHLNQYKHAHYSQYYTPKLIDIVAKRYKTDIETFKYEFEG